MQRRLIRKSFALLVLVAIGFAILWLTWFESRPSEKSFVEINFSPWTSHLDKFHRFKIENFVATGKKWSELSASRKVCLATQSSVDRVYWLLNTTKTWSGPISVAIFTPGIKVHKYPDTQNEGEPSFLGVDFEIARGFLRFLARCYPRTLEQIGVHFVHPRDEPQRESPDVWLAFESSSCLRSPGDLIQDALKLQPPEYQSMKSSLKYPQSLMRNTAKGGCQTDFTFVVDVDMVPNPGLDLGLDELLARVEACDAASDVIGDGCDVTGDDRDGCVKCAFVVPVYEVSKNATHFPVDKNELINFVHSSLSREFHKEIFDLNQKPSNLSFWEKLPQEESLSVGYRIAGYRLMYEPVYVSRPDVPQFDERFIGYGMTRNTQAYEMFIAGYSFYVLNNAFLSHWGYSVKNSTPDWRVKQRKENELRFESFAREVSARYGRDPLGMVKKFSDPKLNVTKIISMFARKKPPRGFEQN